MLLNKTARKQQLYPKLLVSGAVLLLFFNWVTDLDISQSGNMLAFWLTFYVIFEHD